MSSDSGAADFFNMAEQTSNMFTEMGGAHVEAGAAEIPMVGRRARAPLAGRLFPGIDLMAGATKSVPVAIGAASRMSPGEAGEWTRKLLRAVGLDGEDDANAVAFVKAACLCAALNGSTVLVEARVTFAIGGSVFGFRESIVDPLGSDLRRYFRAYADNTREWIRENFDIVARGAPFEEGPEYDAYIEAQTFRDSLMTAAAARGLSRAPDLAFDFADYCTGLSPAERQIIAASKSAILADGGANMADNPVVYRTAGSLPPGPRINKPVAASSPLDGY